MGQEGRVNDADGRDTGGTGGAGGASQKLFAQNADGEATVSDGAYGREAGHKLSPGKQIGWPAIPQPSSPFGTVIFTVINSGLRTLDKQYRQCELFYRFEKYLRFDR